MQDEFFEREAPKPWGLLHPGLWSLLLILVSGALLGLAIGSGAMDWLEESLPIPKSALGGTVVAAVLVPAIGAGVLPLWWRRRYGACHLRGDVLTFEPGGLSIPRSEIRGWRRGSRGLLLDSALHPDNVAMRPLLIPVEGEEELTRALRWLEASDPEAEAAEETVPEEAALDSPEEGSTGKAPAQPSVEPIAKLDPRDQVFGLVAALGLIAALPLLGGLRFGWEAVPLTFGLGGILSTCGSAILYFCITRHSLRVLTSERALLIARRRLPYEELSSVSLAGRTLAWVHSPPGGKERRGWTVLPAERVEALGAELRERLGERLGSSLPSWARSEPRRGLARVLLAILYAVSLGLFSLPRPLYGRAFAPFGVYQELRLRDDDGHVMTLLYSPGQERPRFVYLSSEGVMGGIAGYEITVPGLVGDPSYGMRLGSGSRQINVAEGRIQDGAYQRPLAGDAQAVLRFGDGDWRDTREPLPRELLALALEHEEVRKLESLPAALEPLLEDPSCPRLLRDFVVGRTSWRVHEVSDPQGERLVAVVLQGRVRCLALLPEGQPYGVEFAVVAGQKIFFRSLSHGVQGGRLPGLPVLSKKEDSQVCWLGPSGSWGRAPIGTVELERLLEALEAVRAGESARKALRGLLGRTYPSALER